MQHQNQRSILNQILVLQGFNTLRIQMTLTTFIVHIQTHQIQVQITTTIQRTRDSSIQCMMNKQSMESCLLFTLKHEHIDEPVDNILIIQFLYKNIDQYTH